MCGHRTTHDPLSPSPNPNPSTGHPTRCRCLCSPQHPHKCRHLDRRWPALGRRSGETPAFRFCSCLFFTKTPPYSTCFQPFSSPNPKKPAKILSSPQNPPKSRNSIKTKEKKVENNWRTSFGQFGKIELTEKTSRPGSPAGPSHLTHQKTRGPNLTQVF